jgi:hypothetical protein
MQGSKEKKKIEDRSQNVESPAAKLKKNKVKGF